MKSKRKAQKQSDCFDLNTIPDAPFCPVEFMLNLFAVLAGASCMLLVGMNLMGLATVPWGSILELAIAALFMGAAAKALHHLHYLRELAEWRAERDFELNGPVD